MNLLSRWALRAAVPALWVGALYSIAPAAALAVQSEPATSEAPAPDVTSLVLEPVCTTDGLHRFAVNNVKGPDTRFAVAAAGAAGGETLVVEAGQTRHFWIAGQQGASVQIEWTDGSASATAVDEACTPDTVPPDVLIALPPSATEPPPPDPPSSDPSSQPTSGPAAPATTSEEPTPRPPAPAQRRNGDAESPATSPRNRPAPGGSDPAPGTVRGEPRPRRLDGTMVCPDGWIPVDSDADGRFEATDSCEVLVETAAQTLAGGAAFPTVALIVTIGLLIASIGLGAAGRTRAQRS